MRYLQHRSQQIGYLLLVPRIFLFSCAQEKLTPALGVAKIMPESIDFGDVTVGAPPKKASVAIRNISGLVQVSPSLSEQALAQSILGSSVLKVQL